MNGHLDMTKVNDSAVVGPLNADEGGVIDEVRAELPSFENIQ